MIVQQRIHTFLNWWLTGLAALIPSVLLRRLCATPDRLIITQEDGGYRFKHYQVDQVDPIETGYINIKPGSDSAVLPECFSTLKPDVVVTFILPRHLLLTKPLTLPLTATGNLREILYFEMDRQTPFTADSVYFGWHITGRDTANDKLHLDLMVVLKSALDPLLAELDQYQIHPHCVAPDDTITDINLLPTGSRISVDNQDSRLTRRLAIAATCLVFAALYLPLLRQDAILSEMETQVNSLRAQAAEVHALMEQRDSLLARIQFLDEKRKDTALIDVLHDLTTVLPDNTSLDRLMLHNNEMLLYGESGVATALIQLIENSDYFSNVQFQAPVTRNNQTGNDQFQISTLVSRGDSG